MADQTLKTLHSFLTETDTKVSSGGTIRNYSQKGNGDLVLCLVHGYPESAYMWRHVIPLLKDYDLFIPELPGYGVSSLPPASDKRTVGKLIFEALQSVFGKDKPVIWCGHDRGGRVGHRMIVDNDPSHNIKGAVIMDIVPTTEQFRAFANPAASVAYYHWPFLATESAPHMLEAMGGGYWVETNLNRMKGTTEAGVKNFKSDHAWDHYCHQFNKPECLSGSCADYKSGAEEDIKEQEKDQKEGKKVKVPISVLYSGLGLAKMHDVPAVWKNWVEGELKTQVAPDGISHFLPEEAPEFTAKQIIEWVDRFSK